MGLKGDRFVNWGGNQACRPVRVEHPATEAELSDVVKRAADEGLRVRAVGAGHSFTAVAMTEGVLIVLDKYDQLLEVDQTTSRVTVQAGMPLKALNESLLAVGLALPNLGDIQVQTVAGALSTSTHGTGTNLGVLATQIVGLSLVTADGSVLQCDADSTGHEAEVFHCARVSLGALGVLSTVTLQAVPAFRLHAIEEPVRLEAVLEDLDDLADANDHYEFYWVPHTKWCLTKRNNRTEEMPGGRTGLTYLRDKYVLENLGFGTAVKAGKLSPRLGRKVASIIPGTGRTEYVDWSHRVFTSPRYVRFVEMEYSVPRSTLRHCLTELVAAHERSGLFVSFPVEIRWVKADDIPLSTASGRDSAYIAVHIAKGTPYEPWFRIAEAIFDEVGGRPHWGKMHYQRAESLAPRYPQWDRFWKVRQNLDPEDRFGNAETRRVLGPAG